jgi:hypothetical protein
MSRDISNQIPVISGVIGAPVASDVNPSRNDAGTGCDRGSVLGTVSPDTLITGSTVRSKAPPANGGEATASGIINASASAPATETDRA